MENKWASGEDMKISIEEIGKEQTEEIIIKCREVNENILRLLKILSNENDILLGYDRDNIHRIKTSDVYYIESVDNKVFIYCKKKIFESKQKLYELEEMCAGNKFFRASKSIIINLTKVSYVKPSISGRFEAKLDNGEYVAISRHYVPVLKKMLGL